MHSDDGIVLRLPDTDAEPPGAEIAVFEPDEIESLVTEEVGGSALFASRFRECAARALLLPRRDPRRRTPLWQQRQRANQLLQVASEYGDFPVVLEAMRECLQDVFDVPGLVGLMRDLASRSVRLVEVETPSASPFARSLLFGYVGDVPLRGRRAAGRAPGAGAVARLRAAGRAARRDRAARAARRRRHRRRSSRRSPGWPQDRHARGPDQRARPAALGRRPDHRRGAGARAPRRTTSPRSRTARRAIRVRIAGEQRWLAIEDAGRVRDALGAALPVGRARGVHRAGPRSARRPRLALRPHPRPVPSRATSRHRLGLGVAVVVRGAGPAGRAPAGSSRASSGPAGSAPEWCDAEVLRTIRRRSLAALRKEVEPVPPEALARFIPAWQGVGAAQSSARRGRAAARDRAARRRCRCRPARWRPWCCPAGSPTTPPRCSTS